ncbi:hypothetical protein MTR_3g103430 [Medicago truncatula]|uniref:Uncharacterized protein n=1 Tax=Medicago truncatula TaxID=3880 RepID=A0A072V212_MEDTR|nr:hypothetical protein MTR_3g103430 [Medicago truncatula]
MSCSAIIGRAGATSGPCCVPHLHHFCTSFSSPFLFQSHRNSKPLRATITISCSSNKAKQLREILDSPRVHQGPACFDALSANLVQSAEVGCDGSGFGGGIGFVIYPASFTAT